MAKLDLKVNERTGLVPIVCLVSEAGLGLRKGEVRGVSLETAEFMIGKKSAAPYSEKAVASAEKAKAEELQRGPKGLADQLPGFDAEA